MENIKKYRTVLACCLCILVFIITDSFVLPEKTEKEKVENKKSILRKSRKRASSFIFFTEKSEYFVNANFYSDISIGDSINVTKSIISGVTKKVSKSQNEYFYNQDTRFLTEGLGALFVPFFMIAILLSIKFMPQLNSLKGDINATIGLTTFSILILLSYLFYF